MPASPNADSSRLLSFPSPVDSPWQVLHHGHGIIPGRVPGVLKPPVEPYAAHRGSGCFSGNGGTGMRLHEMALLSHQLPQWHLSDLQLEPIHHGQQSGLTFRILPEAIQLSNIK